MAQGVDAFERALDGFEAVVRVAPDQSWSLLTPCDPWTCSEVVGHVVGGVRWAATLVAGASDGSGPPPGSSETGAPLPTLLSARRDLRAACTPEVITSRVRWPFGEQTVDTGLGWFSLEVLVHTWDLAEGLDRDVVLDPTLVTEHLARLRPLSRHLRGPGGYGPELDPGSDAGEQERLLAFLGRRTKRG